MKLRIFVESSAESTITVGIFAAAALSTSGTNVALSHGARIIPSTRCRKTVSRILVCSWRSSSRSGAFHMKFTATPCGCRSRTAFSAPACIAFQYLCNEPCGTAAIFNSILWRPLHRDVKVARASMAHVSKAKNRPKSQACAASYGETCRVETALCAVISWELLDAYDLPRLIGSSPAAPHPIFLTAFQGWPVRDSFSTVEV